ncbi:MAG TPA: ribonuclease P protein component [Candidatus Obscuribacterales bacterium]
MLPASERLSRDSLFQRVYAGRKNVSTPLVTLYVLERQARSAPRRPLVGFVVGKKVHNKAAYRNLAKRRVREAYRAVRLGDASVKQWYAMVWVVHNKVLNATWDEVLKAVAECLVRADRKYGRHRSGPRQQGEGGATQEA